MPALAARAPFGPTHPTMGVPLVYLPWVSFPLGNERKSGFLYPVLTNSKAYGYGIEVPYYFALSPNSVWNGIGRCTAAMTVPSLGATAPR